MASYTRENPSPRYVELLGFYREMHVNGAVDQNMAPEETFDGRSLPSHAAFIQAVLELMGSKTLLDYGSGKGRQYMPMKLTLPDGTSFPDIKSYWNVDSITCYDPGYEPFSTLPADQFDGVVSTDVLEHCPKEDVPWILDEIFGFARDFVYLNVACVPAKKTLPNGENAHCTIEPVEWWQEQFDARIADQSKLQYYASFDIIDPRDPAGKKVTRVNCMGKNHPAS